MVLSHQDNPFLLYSQGGPVPIQDPKFLVAAAEEALSMVIHAVLAHDDVNKILKRREFHIVVIGPELVTPSSPTESWPQEAVIRPNIIAEHSEGKPTKWKYPYKDIARDKARQLWDDRNNGGTDIAPHLLFKGDTPFWGGVKRSGIVVACSGVQPYFDRMIAGMVADACIGIAYDHWIRSPDHADDELCFLT